MWRKEEGKSLANQYLYSLKSVPIMKEWQTCFQFLIEDKVEHFFQQSKLSSTKYPLLQQPKRFWKQRKIDITKMQTTASFFFFIIKEVEEEVCLHWKTLEEKSGSFPFFYPEVDEKTQKTTLVNPKLVCGKSFLFQKKS